HRVAVPLVAARHPLPEVGDHEGVPGQVEPGRVVAEHLAPDSPVADLQDPHGTLTRNFSFPLLSEGITTSGPHQRIRLSISWSRRCCVRNSMLPPANSSFADAAK